MNDGPLSPLSIPERRERLLVYDDAWKSLRWSSCKKVFTIPNHDTGAYDMSIAPGGILTLLSKTDFKIIFMQIPSNLRDIPMRQWELSFSFGPQACALDPSEDILVVLQRHGSYLHLLSLSTGKPHPLAAVPPLCDPHSVLHQIPRVRIDVVQNHVALLIVGQQLRVWNWKTGQIVLDITSKNVQSVLFLPENCILLATTFAEDFFAPEATPHRLGNCPALVMYNLGQTSASLHKGAAATLIAVFSLELGHEIIPTYMELHYCPNSHPYSREAAVPFFSATEHHLIALRANGTLGGTDLHILLRQVLLIPMVRLTSYISSSVATATPTRYVPWNNWGSVGTRRVPDTGFFQNVLSGSRFIPRPYTVNSVLDVWDFGRACATFARCGHESLPCERRSLTLPSQITGGVAAMISEDAIVICESCPAEERVYLLFF